MINWIIHPLSGLGGVFYGGIFSDITIFTTVIGTAYATARHHNCHVKGCWRFIGTNNDPEVHARACRKHHSLGHLHGKDQSV